MADIAKPVPMWMLICIEGTLDGDQSIGDNEIYVGTYEEMVGAYERTVATADYPRTIFLTRVARKAEPIFVHTVFDDPLDDEVEPQGQEGVGLGAASEQAA